MVWTSLSLLCYPILQYFLLALFRLFLLRPALFRLRRMRLVRLLILISLKCLGYVSSGFFVYRWNISNFFSLLQSVLLLYQSPKVLAMGTVLRGPWLCLKVLSCLSFFLSAFRFSVSLLSMRHLLWNDHSCCFLLRHFFSRSLRPVFCWLRCLCFITVQYLFLAFSVSKLSI